MASQADAGVGLPVKLLLVLKGPGVWAATAALGALGQPMTLMACRKGECRGSSRGLSSGAGCSQAGGKMLSGNGAWQVRGCSWRCIRSSGVQSKVMSTNAASCAACRGTQTSTTHLEERHQQCPELAACRLQVRGLGAC